MSNPLELDKLNRKFYEALVELNSTDVNDDLWLERFRKVRNMRQTEGRRILEGWRCFAEHHGDPELFKITEMFLK